MQKLSAFVLLIVAAVVLVGIIRLALSDWSYWFLFGVLGAALVVAGRYVHRFSKTPGRKIS